MELESEKLQETNEEVSQWESRGFLFVFFLFFLKWDLFKDFEQQFYCHHSLTITVTVPSTISL